MTGSIKQVSYSSRRRKFCLFLFCLATLLFTTYIYLISASVHHLIVRTELQQELRQINSQLSSLDARYIDAQHRISASIATLEGYTQPEVKIFIDRTEPSLVLNLIGE